MVGRGRYRAAAADKRAWKQALRPKPCKLAMHGQLRQAVASKAGAQLVARADRRLAEADISRD